MLDFKSIGRVYLTPIQKKNFIIKRLICWIAVLAAADIIYTIFLILFLVGKFA